MIGYWGRPEETTRAKEANGWLHTGDQARIENGRIFITGRIKDIIVTSTGEKIAPADLETAILENPLFAHAMVIGENRPIPCRARSSRSRGPGARAPRAGRRDKSGGHRAHAEFLLKWIAARVKGFPAYSHAARGVVDHRAVDSRRRPLDADFEEQATISKPASSPRSRASTSASRGLRTKLTAEADGIRPTTSRPRAPGRRDRARGRAASGSRPSACR